MKNTSFRIYLFVLFSLIVIIVLIDNTRRKPVNWTPTYSLDDKIPYGLYVLDNEIDSLLNNTQSIYRCTKTPYEYLQNDSTRKTYLFINNHNMLDEQSGNALMHEVEKGSTLFISSNSCFYSNQILNLKTYYLPSDRHIWREGDTQFSLANRHFNDSVYHMANVTNKTFYYNIDASKTTALGFIHRDSTKFANFIRIKHGKGMIFLHNQPIVFTNFGLLDNHGISEYAARVLSYLPENQEIVWFVKNQKKTLKVNTELGVLFKYPALRAAWLIFLYGIIVFIIFRAKRTQRIIPVIKPLRNTTVDFAQTIGNLYFQEDNATNVTEKKIVYFLDKIRRKYYIDTRQMDEKFIRKLQLKSGKDRTLIEKIVWFIRWFNENKRANEKDFLRISELIAEFWDKE